MRIVFVTTKFDFETGGGSSPELDLKIRALKELGNEVFAVTTFSQNNRGPQPTSYPIFNEFIGTSGQLAISWGIYKILKKYQARADVFQVDGVVFLFGAGLYRFLGGTAPALAHFNRELPWFPEKRSRTSRSFQGWLRFLLEKTFGVFLANHLDAFTFTTPFLKTAYNNFGLAEEKSAVVRDFIDSGSFPKTTRERAKSGVITMLCSGRMVWEKGFDIVLRAFGALLDKKRFRLILSGDGPERKNLEKLATELGVSEFVSFPGWVSNEKFLDFLRSADIVILPPWRPDMNSMLLLEAMALGIPSLVPAQSALAWSAGEGAMTFKDLDHEDLAEKIERFAADPELRETLSAKALQRIEELYYKKPAAELNAIMRKLCR